MGLRGGDGGLFADDPFGHGAGERARRVIE